jgi:hypothetical protein
MPVGATCTAGSHRPQACPRAAAIDRTVSTPPPQHRGVDSDPACGAQVTGEPVGQPARLPETAASQAPPTLGASEEALDAVGRIHHDE